MPRDAVLKKVDIESINDKLDHAATVFGGASRINPRSEDRDRAIVRAFPWFVACCVVVSALLVISRGDFLPWKILDDICIVFVTAFALLGTWALYRLDSGPFPLWFLVGFVIFAGAVMWFYVTGAGAMVLLRGASSLKPFIPGDVDEIVLFSDMLLTILVLLLSSVGVLTTISAMIRKYLPGAILSIERSAAEGERGPAASFFMVPDVLDVKEVEMDPVPDSHVFDLRSFIELTVYAFSMGVMVCSALFLNPIVLDAVPQYNTIRIMVLLSVFLPALVIPWQAVKSTGARVLSSAPRPYYLWTGAKKRLFTWYAMLGVFFLTFVISVYYGKSIETILGYYMQYLVPLGAIAVVSGLLYANCFARNLRDIVCYRFYSKRQKMLEEKEADTATH
ncbi:MAG: hypothetical protein IKQ60_08125 [Candidatus Methanomethylophilaceae archaeon]|nr:hypothetical protein [Candidatus Methanomethylophilaceae archaeon]